MVNVYVLNQDLAIEGVIDSYVSLIWRPSYAEIGDFELYMGASDKAISLLQQNRYLVRDTDITTDSNGVITYKKVMIIKNITLSTDVENGDYFTVTGRELKFLLHQRIVWGQYNLNSTVEYALRRLIGSNAVEAVEPTRVIPNMQFTEAKGFTERLDKQVSNTPLDEAVSEICNTYGYGWDIYITNNKITVDIYKGVDRSYGQSTNPYVVFSDTFDNLYNTEYVCETENYSNMALVGGEGEGLSRIYGYYNNDVGGLERYEMYVDARDLSQNLESETDRIELEDYLILLDERAKENIATMTVTEGFTGEVLSDISFKYGEDFNLGDVVTVINKYGIQRNVRVVSAIESEGEDGSKLIPQFSV